MSDQIVNIVVNHTVKQVNIEVSPAVQQQIDITAWRGDEPLLQQFRNVAFLTGAKKTGVDAGTVPSFSFTDDYIYYCVMAGEAGTAIWKRAVLFQT